MEGVAGEIIMNLKNAKTGQIISVGGTWTTLVFLAKPSAILAALLILPLSVRFAQGQPDATGTARAATPAPPPSTPAKKSAAELQKLAEPIALHPDPLIAKP